MTRFPRLLALFSAVSSADDAAPSSQYPVQSPFSNGSWLPYFSSKARKAVLVDLMDRGVDQTELDDGTNVLDEARIRCAAAGRQFRDTARHGLHGVLQGRDEGAGLRQENVAGAGEAQIVFCADFRGSVRKLVANPGFDRRAPPEVIVTNVDLRDGLARYDVRRRVRYRDDRHLQI